jgi:hypothetical protein
MRVWSYGAVGGAADSLPGFFVFLFSKHLPARYSGVGIDALFKIVFSGIGINITERQQGSQRCQHYRTIISFAPDGAFTSAEESIEGMGTLGFKVPEEGRDIIRVIDHDEEMDVVCLYQESTDLNRIKELSSSEAALDDRLTEWVAQEEQPLFYAKGAHEYAVVRVVFHPASSLLLLLGSDGELGSFLAGIR